MRTLPHHITATHPSTHPQFITSLQRSTPSTHASAASLHHSNAAPLLTHTLLLPPSCLVALDRSPPAITPEKDLANAQPLRELLIECSYKHGKAVSKADANKMNFAQLRDGLLALAPLDRAHVIAVNTGKAAQHTQTAHTKQHSHHTISPLPSLPPTAEAEYWKKSEGLSLIHI